MASNGEIAGVVAGAVALFVAISVIPIIIMWRHRRKEAARRARELAALREYGCMQQVGVERWLEEQRRDAVACSRSNNSNNNNAHDFGRYAQEPCAVCLSTLLPSSPSQSSLPCSDPERHTQSKSDLGLPAEASLLVLNRCGHAFHYPCLASWWEYRPYRCPVCQASYAPDE